MSCGRLITPSMACGDGGGGGRALCLSCAKPNKSSETPSPTIVALATRTGERLAILARVQPLFSAALKDVTDEAELKRLVLLAVSVTSAILKGE